MIHIFGDIGIVVVRAGGIEFEQIVVKVTEDTLVAACVIAYINIDTVIFGSLLGCSKAISGPQNDIRDCISVKVLLAEAISSSSLPPTVGMPSRRESAAFAKFISPRRFKLRTCQRPAVNAADCSAVSSFILERIIECRSNKNKVAITSIISITKANNRTCPCSLFGFSAWLQTFSCPPSINLRD